MGMATVMMAMAAAITAGIAVVTTVRLITSATRTARPLLARTWRAASDSTRTRADLTTIRTTAISACTGTRTHTRRSTRMVIAPGIEGTQGTSQHSCWDNEAAGRSEEHTSELQSPCNLVCRLLLE